MGDAYRALANMEPMHQRERATVVSGQRFGLVLGIEPGDGVDDSIVARPKYQEPSEYVHEE